MKMQSVHVQQLTQAIRQVAAEHSSQLAKHGDLTTMRVRWALLNRAIKRGYIYLSDGAGMRGSDPEIEWPVYAYCNDSHIDTALRRVMNVSIIPFV